jgi:LAO/AO transport system kinase
MHQQENSQKENVSSKSAERIKSLRRKQLDPEVLIDRILKGDKPALSQAITSVESRSFKHRKLVSKLIEGCLPRANNSVRIGITGVPGVGKSTFIEVFGNYLINRGKKVAVLAVDPTSSISKGSILGDKTRMAELVKQENAFIRPTASGESLGGVARKTRESIILCEAAGYDTILIETVGVGQSETVVHSMSDFFLLLKIAGAGDELQGIKRGIMEMADAIVINKADGENKKATRQAKSEFRKALHLYPDRENNWKPKVKTCSALYNSGIESIWEMIKNYFKLTESNGYFQQKRNEQNKYWLLQTINEELKNNFYKRPEIESALEKELKAIEDQETTPFHAAQRLLNM